ncbi:MAG: HD domain-containing protein [Thermoplasmatales archaeon]|nr:HD domain-containing protein [Thermoplasmatales archaeon]
MENVKFIRDSLYGNIKVSGAILELLETPELQRLHGIKQLGFTYLVYPGANHTRLEHSLGTSFIASKICEALDIKNEGIVVASLLHDVGHGPFSHTLEAILHERTGKNHVDIGKEIILGKISNGVAEVLDKHGIDKEEIVKILDGKKGYHSEIIHGPLDADQIDYLMRDAYYTGVAYGVIDSDRLIQTMKLYDGKIVFEKKGISALESLLVARALMYSSVYLHKTVRIAELMLVKAIKKASDFNFSLLTDCELIEKLKSEGEFQRDIVNRLKYRKLFKKAFAKSFDEMNEKEKEIIAEIENPSYIEEEIARKVGIDDGYVIVDIPGKDILLSEPRIRKVDIKIFEDGKIRNIGEITPIANALQMRGITDWAIMVSCPEEYRSKVEKYSNEIIFGIK